MRVASYNVHNCVGRDGRYLPERILEVLTELKAEVIAVQEITLDFAGGLFHYFQQASGLQAIDGTLFDRNKGRYGNLLLLDPTIIDVQLHDLSFADSEPRGAVEVLLEHEPQPLQVVATHLGLSRGERRTQINRLRAMLAATAGPTVLLGDFNTWCGALELKPLLRLGFHRIAVRSFPTR